MNCLDDRHRVFFPREGGDTLWLIDKTKGTVTVWQRDPDRLAIRIETLDALVTAQILRRKERDRSSSPVVERAAQELDERE